MATSATTHHSAVSITWGNEGELPLELPSGWPEPVVSSPDLTGAIEDYAAALGGVLDRPLGVARLEEQVHSGMKAAIVVDDPSRWTPVREALAIVLPRLHAAGVRVEDVSISVGVGRHHAVDDASMRKRVGDDVADRYRCFSPPVDDLSAYADLGRTPEGVPVRVFRPVAEAGLRILIGSVLPHLQAGFGGGYKLIFPGTSHRSTLGALHRQGLGGDVAGLLGGDARENPMRHAIRSAAALLPGPCFSISHILGRSGEVFRVAAGSVDAVQDELAAEARRRFRTPPGTPADLIVASNAPWPGDPMQSFKVLLDHREAARPGGVLVGFFWTDPAEMDRSFPLGVMKAIASTGRAGGWIARGGLSMADRLASAVRGPNLFLIRWARELVVDRTVLIFAPPLCSRIGPRLGPIRIFSEQGPLWEAAARSLPASPEIRVFPLGGLTFRPKH